MNKTKLPNKIIQGTHGRMKAVKDFLLPPEELVFREPLKKITISLNESSVIFFKHQAQKLGSSYQYMIRKLLNDYAFGHENKNQNARKSIVRVG